jgi:hypothetical protein
VISAQFIFKHGTHDDEFQRLDALIEAYVATIPGLSGAEKWVSFNTHREAKGKYQNWYDGCQIVVSEIKKSCGDGAIEMIAKA